MLNLLDWMFNLNYKKILIILLIVVGVLSWLLGNNTVLSWIGVILLILFIWEVIKSAFQEIKMLLEKIMTNIGRIDKIEGLVKEIYYYQGLTTNRNKRIVKMYTDYLIKVEKLPKNLAKLRAEFVLARFGPLQPLENLYSYSAFSFMGKSEDELEYELWQSKEFLNRFRKGEIGDSWRWDVYLNMKDLWQNQGLKSLSKKCKPEEIILEEYITYDSPLTYYVESNNYWEYMRVKAIIHDLNELGIIELVEDYSLSRSEHGTYLRKRKFRFKTLDFKEITKAIYPNKKVPNKEYDSPFLSGEGKPIFYIQAPSSYFMESRNWFWKDTDYPKTYI